MPSLAGVRDTASGLAAVARTGVLRPPRPDDADGDVPRGSTGRIFERVEG